MTQRRWPWMALLVWARIPKRLLMGNDFDSLTWRPREDLRLCRYAKINHPSHGVVMDFDIDRQGARDLVMALGLPFAWIVYNHSSGHLHAAFLPASPLNTRSRAVREHAVRIRRRMTSALRADPAHSSNGVIPNPFYQGPEQHTEWGSAQPIRLAEWHEWIPGTEDLLDVQASPGASLTGKGRNVDLFNALRAIAWQSVHRWKANGDRSGWAEWILRLAETLNAETPDPLSAREVASVARSVSRFAWRTRSPAKAVEARAKRQARRGRRSGQARRGMTRDRDEEIHRRREAGESLRSIAGAMGISHEAVRKVLKRPSGRVL